MDPGDESALLRSPLFQAIGPDLWALLAESGSVHDYGRGEMVFWQGDPADSLFFVLSGCVKLCRETASHDHEVIGVLTAGQIYFEPSMFAAGRHFVIAEAVSFARVVRLDAEVLRAAVLRRPRLAFDLFAISSNASTALVEQVEQLKTRSVPQRIAAFLLGQAELTGEPESFALPFSKTLIARLIGAKLESFSRSLGQLSEHGVEVKNDRVTIQDVDRLADYVRGPIGARQHDRRPILTRFASMGKRRRFDDGLVRVWRKAQSAGAPTSLLLIDVGHHGRPAETRLGEGDRALLAAVGDTVSREADRDGRFMVHYGDDIFAVAAPRTDHGEATALAERLVTILESGAIRRPADAESSIVAAIGTATIVPTTQDRIEKLVCFADIGLYRARTLGRGRICRFHDNASCETAKHCPSGGARIPIIESPHCAECRRDAPSD
jgi:diguanylate cyclase (GGDEF)-like protein